MNPTVPMPPGRGQESPEVRGEEGGLRPRATRQAVGKVQDGLLGCRAGRSRVPQRGLEEHTCLRCYVTLL